MISRTASYVILSFSLLAFALAIILISPASRADDNICDLCDKSSIQIGFGSSSQSHEIWYNLTSAFRLGNQFVIHTDNPWDKPDRPDIVIYASFESQQNVKLSPEYGSCACENQGYRAKISVSVFNLGVDKDVAELAAKLKDDRVPTKLWQDMMGPYVYRINILAPDYGQYATSLLSLSTAASYAIGRAWVDHYRMDDTERARICNYVGSVKQPNPDVEESEAKKQGISPLAARGYGHTSPLMALIK